MLRLAPRRTSTPAVAVTLAEAKAHLRVDHDVDDSLITATIAAATSTVDGWSGILGRCLCTQTWEVKFPDWACGVLRLPFPDVAAETVAVTYLDAADAEQTLDAATYDVVETISGSEIRRRPASSWPALSTRPAPVTVTAAFGYGAAADVPAGIRSALLLMVGDLYRNRETVASGGVAAVPMSTTVEALLAPHRYGWAGA